MLRHAGRRAADWLAARLPYREVIRDHLRGYYAPRNFNLWYVFGALALLVFAIQIISGILLLIHYRPSEDAAFASVQTIMFDVRWGWLVRYLHTTGASLFFVVVYAHMLRGLLYGSYRAPRDLLWVVGFLIYLALVAEAYLGYVLPFGNMSYWGGEVITSIIQSVPLVGNWVADVARGGPGVSTATLGRFMAFHAVLWPAALAILVAVHIVALHHTGSNNPDGVDIERHRDAQGRPLDGIPFHPYYTMKDLTAAGVFTVIFLAIIFYAPTLGGLLVEPANNAPANPLKTPSDITPAWYLAPYYAMLRSVPNKTVGILILGTGIVLPFLLPWLDRCRVRSSRYRPVFAVMVWALAIDFALLGWIGMRPATPLLLWPGRVLLLGYLLFFLALPWVSRHEPTRPVPDRIPP